MTMIHPTAIIDPRATLGAGVEIGPYCIVGGEVILGEHVRLVSHVSIAGKTSIGPHTTIYPFACLGHPPQDLKYKGEPSQLIIGANNTIREYVTMQPGTAGGEMETRVGDNGLFMANTHVAHDCCVGNSVILANCATLAGHVSLGDFAIIGGLAAVLQYVRIGAHAMVSGLSAVTQDVIPYGSVRGGDRTVLSGLNIVGLKRHGFTREEIETLRVGYRALFVDNVGSLRERVIEVRRKLGGHAAVAGMIDFIEKSSKHGVCLPQDDGLDAE